MIPVIIIFFAAYFALLIILMRGWHLAISKSRRTPLFQDPPRTKETISVVIPARNEAFHIGYLLADLARQDDDCFEVIVVDDHSEDNTSSMAENCQRIGEGLRVIRLGGSTGKKAAVTAGVENAHGSIIITTDADCRVPAGWVSSLRKCFASPSVQFVFAGVRIASDKTFWSAVQGLEFASLVGTGVATSGLGYSTLCNGANLAYRKASFLEVGGYSRNKNIASGDDEFLMRTIRAQHRDGILFCADGGAVVETKPVTPSLFFFQRLRWAGKWSRQHSATAFLAIFIWCFHAASLTLVPLIVLNGYLVIPGVLLGVRALLEYLFLKRVCRFLRSRWSLSSFVFLQVVYSPYVVFFGVMANLRPTVWKGRKIKAGGLELHSRLAENP